MFINVNSKIPRCFSNTQHFHCRSCRLRTNSTVSSLSADPVFVQCSLKPAACRAPPSVNCCDSRGSAALRSANEALCPQTVTVTTLSLPSLHFLQSCWRRKIQSHRGHAAAHTHTAGDFIMSDFNVMIVLK